MKRAAVFLFALAGLLAAQGPLQSTAAGPAGATGPTGATGAAGITAFPQAVTGCVSGGVVYGSSSTTQINCSALLGAGNAVWGGGAGAAPYTNTDLVDVAGTSLTGAVPLIVTGSYFSIGTNPSQSGAIRLASGSAIRSRNNANTADLLLLTANSGDQLVMGAAVRNASGYSDEVNAAATGGANQIDLGYLWGSHYWNGSASAADYWLLTDTLGSGTNPTATFTFTHSGGNTGALALSFPGVIMGAGGIQTAAAPTVAASQIGFGSTTAALANCGAAILTTGTACLVINVAGTTRYIPYF